MITSDSRYAQAAHENAVAHLYDALGNPETVVATNQTITGEMASSTDPNALTEVSRDTTYRLTTAQGPTVPLSYMVKMTDNVQLLAYRVRQDPTQWWVIADANPQVRYPFDYVMGKTIYLPE